MTRRLAGYGARQVRNQQALREVCIFFGRVLSGRRLCPDASGAKSSLFCNSGFGHNKGFVWPHPLTEDMPAVAIPVPLMLSRCKSISTCRTQWGRVLLLPSLPDVLGIWHLETFSSPRAPVDISVLFLTNMHFKSMLRRLLCDSTQDPREARPTRPTMSRPMPQYPPHHHHRQAYDGDDDNGPILTSPVRIRPGTVPINRPPPPPRVPDRYAQRGLDAESYEQPRRTERPPRAPVGTTRDRKSVV